MFIQELLSYFSCYERNTTKLCKIKISNHIWVFVKLLISGCKSKYLWEQKKLANAYFLYQ